jgi:hypothetical protein
MDDRLHPVVVSAMNERPAAQAAPPQTATADPQDPLPESNWFWRRLFVGVICAALLALVWYRTEVIGQAALDGKEGAVDGLVSLLKLSLYLTGLVIMLYLIAPSAEQAGKWLATISAWKSGVSTTSTSKATAADGSKAEATTSAGMPVGTVPPAKAGAVELPDYAK